ncbi:hypothetical protein SERLADRAFT_449396 [Serpula lacrymans var. lacrymans S7.9]|uniref:Alpha-type protein kinase domain-containing protein n=1 Tax=Serpula lacrymans var. lacrymans (strain S7.9) TaxID=578457 RepID=F8P558_SERL9|nr:uncharacterized protein SERLADRAFT_449396 [Serpula lacrymans var. lacrymans S7.9]XP_007321531.1 uncharacterized protein SERLADRAFT_451761 [Serpula lacrymans var. lacrymans S7.9]XP_007322668.1 uncharacterized protein SERLADRAFT_452763 [Serpula lacrymans var. lacrymans S7.9]XP_007324793.1 uncharacterized protein SERLADRAFT_454305 [Serpula lacrymans var. lacrymans S7.9]EGO18513.1 hypothetical protein SERLADRAFT_454305 [Serpula lacrymans var. lacrymans S7.9]EGO20702.1 hypothetical protein SERLA
MSKVNRPLVTLTVDCSSKAMLGPAGSFKTCHPASYDLTEALPAEENILQVEAIVAKRCFYRETVQGAEKSGTPSSPSGGRKRLAIKDELMKMLDEANCLYWATSLLALVYNFVDDKLIRRPLDCPPPAIPRLRVVHAALAIPQDSRELRNAVYLLEEKINGNFVKYINNNSAAPRHKLAPPELEIATFLCFAQHTQYHFSQGLVFISDFQGSGGILTDCQVITTKDFADNFGEGNWTATLDNFPLLHKCNQYCVYFGLPSLQTASSATKMRTSQEIDIMSSRVRG